MATSIGSNSQTFSSGSLFFAGSGPSFGVSFGGLLGVPDGVVLPPSGLGFGAGSGVTSGLFGGGSGVGDGEPLPDGEPCEPPPPAPEVWVESSPSGLGFGSGGGFPPPSPPPEPPWGPLTSLGLPLMSECFGGGAPCRA